MTLDRPTDWTHEVCTLIGEGPCLFHPKAVPGEPGAQRHATPGRARPLYTRGSGVRGGARDGGGGRTASALVLPGVLVHVGR